MYIPAFLCGVLFTLMIEMGALIGYSIYLRWWKK